MSSNVPEHHTLVNLKKVAEMLPNDQARVNMYEAVNALIAMTKASALMQGMNAGLDSLSLPKNSSLDDPFEIKEFVSCLQAEIDKYKKL